MRGMKRATDPADDTALHALATELRVLVGQLRRRLRDQANMGDLSTSQIAVLGRLDRDGPATVSTLARAEGMKPQSMGAIVAGLVAADMLSTSPDPHDGRQTLLSVTAACRRWIKASRAAREDWLADSIRSQLTLREREQLARAIDLLRRIVVS